MKRILQFIIVLFSYQQFASAQFKIMAESPAFEEPEEGFGKLLLLKNGSTILIQIHREQKDGIDIQIYNKEHVQTLKKHIRARPGGNYATASVNSIFEINGDVIILITAVIEKKPALFRMVLNTSSGELKTMEKIAETGRHPIDEEHPLFNPFLVRKDPNSDYYAVAISHDREEFPTDEQLEVMLYDGHHREISRADYALSDNKYGLLQLHDLVVYNGGTIGLLAYAYSYSDVLKRREGNIVLLRLEKNEHTLTWTMPDLMNGYQIDGGLIRYNPVTGKLILLGCALINDKTEKEAKNKVNAKPDIITEGDIEKRYIAFAAFANPTTMSIEKVFDVFPAAASDKRKTLLKDKKAFSGMPQNLFLNADGGFSIVYEQLVSYIPAGSNIFLHTVHLGDIAVSTFNKEGVMQTSALVPKEQRMYPSWLEPFYHSRRDNTGNPLLHGQQFKSFAYLNTGNKNYILLNDTERNIDELKSGSMITIMSVGACDAFFYPIDGRNALPDRQFMFENEKKKKTFKLAAFTISDYDPANNIYVTMQVENGIKGKNTKIIWLQP